MRAVASAAVGCAAALVAVLSGSSALASAPAPAEQVLLDDIGGGFRMTSDVPSDLGQVTRTFTNGDSAVSIMAFPVTDPPGVRSMFALFDGQFGSDRPTPPQFDLATWLELTDGTDLAVAGPDHLFIVSHIGPEPADAESFVIDIAERQLAAAGGGPAPEPEPNGDRAEAESEVVAMLPEGPPPEYGLGRGVTIAGRDELRATDGAPVEVVDFLNRRSTTATRLWSSFDGDDTLVAAVSITRYPYDLFAAAAASAAADVDSRQVISTDAMQDVADVVAYTTETEADSPMSTVGASFRQGDVYVDVVVAYGGDVDPATAASLTADLVRLTSASVPAGDTAPYDFPDAPGKALGLGLTALIVAAAGGGSTAIARVRARRVRRGWQGGELPPPDVPGAAAGAAVDLDPDAARLRRRGAIVAIGQLLTVVVGVVALAGDFGWPGVIVAALALLAGLIFTHWWQRRELGLLGPKAPPKELVLPRPAGAVVGLLSLAVLGFGVGFALKGVRYLVLNPTLAQMKWADRFGTSARAVGVIFAIGGFVIAVIGGYLFRWARALGRAGTKRTLASDPRPAALYLRSFGDDDLPLPTIASARRPLFELFSLRGADPFEESLAWELNSYGPVVAVGRPGRSLASLGAAREHLPDATWQDQVAARMDEAGIIAVATGESDGLAWELRQVVNGGHMPKTFFVFPPVAPGDVDRRWEHTVAALTQAGQPVGPLPVPASMIHTVRIGSDGTANVTFASRRDEATYRTAVDHSVALGEPDSAPHPATSAMVR